MLWLPRKACLQSRMITRVCNRMRLEHARGKMLTAGHMADDLHCHSCLAALFQDTQDGFVGDVHVINQKFLLGSFDERLQAGTRIDRADQKLVDLRVIGLPLGVTFKKPRSFLSPARGFWSQSQSCGFSPCRDA